MDFTALVFCLFLLHCQAEGDVKEETLYVKTGTDLLLDVGEHVTLNKSDHMSWKFNSTVNIVRLTQNKTTPNPIYTGRAELFSQNQSLLLKNVQKTDSGEYRAEVSGFTNRVLFKYQVRVLDPVSDVKLEVKQCSSDRSDLTVTCTTLDGLLNSTFICENTTCSHEGGEKNIPPGASVKVYLKNGSVTCHHSNRVSSKEDTKTVKELCGTGPVSDVKVDLENGSVTCHHSNQVSSKEDTKTVEDLCTKDPLDSMPKDNLLKIYVTVTVALVILLITCVALAVYCRQRKKGETEEVKDPVYADVSRALKRDQRPGPGPRNDAHAESPDVIYSAVASHRTAPTEAPTEPECFYSSVKKN